MEGDNIRQVCKDYLGYHWRGILAILLPIVLMPIPIIARASEYSCGYVIVVMAIYWATECIPIYATSLIPVIILPLLGVLDSNVVCKQFMSDPLFLFFGGGIVAIAWEFCKLHQRLAYRMLIISKCNLKCLHSIVIVFTALLSMCLNNVATTLVMCPVTGVILEELELQGISNQFQEAAENELASKYEPLNEEVEDPTPKYPTNTTVAFYLGVAYAATLGGTMTLIGSVTNLVYNEIYEKRFPKTTDTLKTYKIILYTLPLIVIEIVFVCFYLQVIFMGLFRGGNDDSQPTREASRAASNRIKTKFNELGRLSVHEWQVLILFCLMVVLLFTRDPGWATTGPKIVIFDSWPIMFVVLMMFMIPMNYTFCKYCFGSAPFTTAPIPSLISWKAVHSKFPWGILFLVGAGYCLGEAVKESKLAEKLAFELRGAEYWSPFAVQIIAILITIAATNLCSNVTVSNVLVAIFAELARISAMHPLNLILPVGVACSMAFLLPVSTPPNTIIRTFYNIRTKHLLIGGIGPTILAIVLLIILSAFWQNAIFPVTSNFPEWAQPPQ